jgi:hypothetical protein
MNLKHHPFPVLATLERVVAVSFAFPESVLRPLKAAGLQSPDTPPPGSPWITSIRSR